MPVDVVVEIGMPDDKGTEAAYAIRDALARVLEPLGVREVGGGTQFEPLVADARYECPSTRQARVAAGVIATALLERGYVVRGRGGKLLAREEESDGDPDPGTAVVVIVAPVGTV